MLVEKLLRQIDEIQLDLNGKVVLTEAANGAYIVTPVLAALAGAEVYAFSKTTRYGTVDEVFNVTQTLVKQFTNKDLSINLINEITPEVLAKADVITNSGHLRPLSKDKLQYVKNTAVIPLMYEAWELRSADLDLDYVRQKGIKIGATNERHENVDVFNYLGDMALKLIFDAGFCLYRNKFILVSNNDFGPYIAKVLSKVCKGLGVIDLEENKHKYVHENIDWLGNFPEVNIPENYKNSEAVIFTAYPFEKTWIGNSNEPLELRHFREKLQNPFILRFAGDINTTDFKMADVKYYPENVTSGHMGIIPSEIGFDPIIRLQAGGLKVAECMLKNEIQYNNTNIVELL